jgi:hypothetical protein
VSADGTFKVEGVLGTCAARVNGGFGRWFAKSITYDGRDLMDQPMAFTIGQQLRDVEVVMIDKPTELTLHVTDDHGAATRDYVALLFPTNQARWTDNTGRFIRTLVPTPDLPGSVSGASAPSIGANLSMVAGVVAGGTIGSSASYLPPVPNVTASRREVIGGVPPGEYYVIAVDDLEVEGYRDPEFLAQLARGATRVNIVEGVPLELNLRRSKI